MQLLYRNARIAAFAWLLLASGLFFLPGSALPKTGWLTAIYADKWVHVGIFALLVFFWGIAFHTRHKKKYAWLLLAALLYGLLVEVVQEQLVINRDFDLWDVVFDMVGSIAGVVALRYVKK